MCREKPIEQCITYKAQCQHIELAVDTTQSDSESSSTSDADDETPSKTKHTMLQRSQSVTESKFICRQPPHGSRSLSSQQSTAVTSAGVSPTMQLQADDNSK